MNEVAILIFSALSAGTLVWIKMLSGALDRANLRNDKAEERFRADVKIVADKLESVSNQLHDQIGQNKVLSEQVNKMTDDRASFAVSSAAYETKIANLEQQLTDQKATYELKIDALEKRVSVLELALADKTGV